MKIPAAHKNDDEAPAKPEVTAQPMPPAKAAKVKVAQQTAAEINADFDKQIADVEAARAKALEGAS